MFKSLPVEAPSVHPVLGKWVARCGPSSKFTTFGKVIVGVWTAIPIALMLFALVAMPFRDGQYFLLVGLVVLALVALVVMRFGRTKEPQVDMFIDGIRYVYKQRNEVISWPMIDHAKLTTWYDTRFSSFVQVQLTISQMEPVSFNSRVEGDPDLIIDTIAKRAKDVETASVSL